MKSENIFNNYIDKSTTELKEHVARIVEMCVKFSEKLDLDDAKKELLINAAWLHDIAKFDDRDHHKKNMLRMLSNKYQKI